MLLGDDDSAIPAEPGSGVNKPMSTEEKAFTSKASSRRLRKKALITTESSQSYHAG